MDLRIGGTFAAAVRPPLPTAPEGHPSSTSPAPRAHAQTHGESNATIQTPLKKLRLRGVTGKMALLLLEEQELECSPTAGSRDGCTARDALGMQGSKDAESPTRIWKAEIVLGLMILYVYVRIIEGTLATARNPRPRPPNTNNLPPNAQRPNAATNNETAGNPYRPHDMIT